MPPGFVALWMNRWVRRGRRSELRSLDSRGRLSLRGLCDRL